MGWTEIVVAIASGLITLGGAAVLALVPDYAPAYKEALFFWGWAGVIVGAVALALALIGNLVRVALPTLVPMWKIRFDDVVPFRRLISVDRATQIVYDKLLNHTVGEAARQLGSGSPRAYIFHALMRDGATPLWARRVESTRLLRLGDGASRSVSYTPEDNTLELLGSGREKLTDAHMLRRDMRAGLKRLRAWKLE